MREKTYSPIFWAILATTGSLGLAAASHAQTQSTASGTTATPSSTSVTPPVRELDDVVIVGTVDDLQSLDFYAPNSSIVISEKEIEAQGARKIDQALHYQAGILTEPFGADNKVEWFKIRGFDASMSLDGTPTTPNGFFVWKPEIFGVESIEVLKGPSSLVFGASQTGGVVNLVTKRPHKEEALLLNAEVGNRDRLGISADYNGIANDEGNVYYRVVTQVRREDGTQHRTDMHSYYLAPSVTVDFSPRTSLTLLTSVQHEEGTPTNGFLPAYGTVITTPYGRISRRLNAGEPDFDHLRRTQISAGWTFTHEFADDWTFTQNYKFSRLNINQQNVYAYNYNYDNPDPHELMRGYSLTHGSTKNNYIDNRVSGKLNLGQYVELLPTVGFDYLKSDTSGNNNGFGWVPNLDMFNPVYGKPFDVTATPYDLDSKQLGVYGSLQMRVAHNWLFNAGIRHDKAKSDGFISGSDSSYDVNHNSVNAGVMYMSDYGIAPYFNYSESFRPIDGVDGAGNAYKPYEGQQAEFGLKLEPSWLDGTLTLAYFDAKEKNALISNSSNIQSQSGKRTNKGVEIQGDFNLGSNTALTATYTHNHSRQDVSGDKTIRTALIPKHQASLWLSHELALPNSQRLTAAAGVRYNGSSVDENNHPGETIPSYTLLDLMARYQFNPEWSLQLNARNLTDKTYVSGCDYYCYYGNGRTVDLQLQYQWR